MESLEQYIDQVKAWQAELGDIVLYAPIVLFILLIGYIAYLNVIRRNRRKYAPLLVYDSFQISPMGTDGYLKLSNFGQTAHIQDIRFKKRYDIVPKTRVADTIVSPQKTYSLLLQNTGQRRLKRDFLIELTYKDQIGHQYVQKIDLRKQQQSKAKYKGKGVAPVINADYIGT